MKNLINTHRTPLGIGRFKVDMGEGLPDAEFTAGELNIIELFKTRGFLAEAKTAEKVPAAKTPAKKAAPIVEEVTAPIVEEVTAPIVEEVTAPIVEEVTAPIVEEVKVAPQSKKSRKSRK